MVAASLRLPAVVLAAVVSGCWGTPKLAVRGTRTGATNHFEFGYCKDEGRSPPLISIDVGELDAAGHEREPLVCRLSLRPNTGTTPIGAWTYGTDLPSLATERCTPLEAGRSYRVSIQGGGNGSEVFTLSPAGELHAAGESCR